uniref:Uncharacterized protein n=1 Tax=Davidia involucrata TaxID=16924 RepID=A0A5B7AAC0_DAVIN
MDGWLFRGAYQQISIGTLELQKCMRSTDRRCIFNVYNYLLSFFKRFIVCFVLSPSSSQHDHVFVGALMGVCLSDVIGTHCLGFGVEFNLLIHGSDLYFTLDILVIYPM